jgi:hypothetical protein
MSERAGGEKNFQVDMEDVTAVTEVFLGEGVSVGLPELDLVMQEIACESRVMGRCVIMTDGSILSDMRFSAADLWPNGNMEGEWGTERVDDRKESR